MRWFASLPILRAACRSTAISSLHWSRSVIHKMHVEPPPGTSWPSDRPMPHIALRAARCIESRVAALGCCTRVNDEWCAAPWLWPSCGPGSSGVVAQLFSCAYRYCRSRPLRSRRLVKPSSVRMLATRIDALCVWSAGAIPSACSSTSGMLALFWPRSQLSMGAFQVSTLKRSPARRWRALPIRASPATISRRTCSARLPRPRADHDHARYRRGRSCRGSSPMSKQTNVGSARRRSRRQDRPEGRRGNSICGSMGRREAPSGHDLWVGATRAPECFCGSMGLYRRTFRLSV